MTLTDGSPSKHNRMLGQRIAHPKSTNYHGDAETSPRPVKRLKREDGNNEENHRSPPKRTSELSEDDADISYDSKPLEVRKTELESALPPIPTDQEAIDEYEARRAAEEEEEKAVATAEGRLSRRKWIRGKNSIYVDAFNLALDTVLEEEEHLFDAAEKRLFQYWAELSYEAQYLYVRLFLRKTAAWHRISGLGYHSDIGDLDKAIEELQLHRSVPSSASQPESHPGELKPPEGTTLGTTFTFADHSKLITSLEEASSLLKLDELKNLAKDARVQGKNKKELLQALRRASRQQVGLVSSLKRADSNASHHSSGDRTPQSRSMTPHAEDDDEDDDRNRDAHFTKKIMNETGPCIRLSLAPLKLFERVHLVFYRSTEWTEKSLTAIILAKIARWNFPQYIVSRSASVFGSRGLLLEYEAALRTQFKVDSILEFNGPPSTKDLDWILDIYHEIYPRWRALLEEEQRKEDSIYRSGEGSYLRRLSPAWVYTRILHKASDILGKRKDHEEEHRLLSELLAQRLFHHSRRGAWYQRKALLEEHYMHAFNHAGRLDPEAHKRNFKRTALRTCEDGLQDPLVHLIYHYDLQKRVTKLEKGLKIPKREQHTFSHVRLAAPVEVYIEGTRVERDPDSSKNRRNSSPHPKPTWRGQKTIWFDPLEDDGECSVEAMCLSHYRADGWKGYHCEGRLARTLFAYLFYDVMFTYIPNVFQTPFQTCPLDLHTDAFYPSRFSEINHRLLDISNGQAPDLLRRMWNEHQERETCVVGLDWTYPLEDLLEITSMFPGEALASVCKVMAQEYGQRGGGMPDLFLWHPGRREVKFAEVKSENDRLSETQRLWIHVLTGAGVKVELAHAVAKKVVQR